MIRYLVEFALRNKILVLSLGVILVVWGVISFHTLPVEAYPDVANNWVQVISQWPGRAAEEVEQPGTIPNPVICNPIGMGNCCSTSSAGRPGPLEINFTHLFATSRLALTGKVWEGETPLR